MTTRLILLIVALSLWMTALLVPIPRQAALTVLGSDDNLFTFGKVLHVSAYAFLTLFAGWVARGRRRWLGWSLLVLSLHGGSSEFFQQYTGRGASWRDVGLDHIGIGIGLLIGWRWWRPLWSRGS